jgi:hypothetical protein
VGMRMGWIIQTAIVPASLLAVGVAAPASADAGEYTSYLKQHASALATRYSDQALLKEGQKVCNAVAQGADEDDVADMAQRDLPGATESDGYQIWHAAGAYLCLGS